MSAPGDEYDVALLVAAAFESLGIDYALLAERLGEDFEADEVGLLAPIRERGSHSVFHLPTVQKIDLFVRGGSRFDESEFARRIRTPVRQAALRRLSRGQPAAKIVLVQAGW